jgi:hypothetical protein
MEWIDAHAEWPKGAAEGHALADLGVIANGAITAFCPD